MLLLKGKDISEIVQLCSDNGFSIHVIFEGYGGYVVRDLSFRQVCILRDNGVTVEGDDNWWAKKHWDRPDDS